MNTTKIKTIIEEILKKTSVNYTEVEVCDDEIMSCRKFVVRSSDSNLLIGRDGENLQALSHIVKRIVLKDSEENKEEVKFYVDVEDYYRKKLERMKDTALMMAGRAKTFKRDVEMEPASSYERMIMHSILEKEENVTTESDGEGRFRRVIIKFVG